MVKKDLQVLVSASDRLKDTGFEGVVPNPKNRTFKRIRPNKNHLKFPLYLDESIGFGFSGEASKSAPVTENLHDAVSNHYLSFLMKS